MSVVFVVIASGVYDQGTHAAFTTRQLAEQFVSTHRVDSDGHHSWRIEELPVDPVAISSERLCPQAPAGRRVGLGGHGPHTWPKGQEFDKGKTCVVCGWSAV